MGSPLGWSSVLHFLSPWTESGIKILYGFYVTSARGGRSNQERQQRGEGSKIDKVRRSAYFTDLLYPSPFVIPLPLGG